jgi:hypothetical protein
MKCKEEKLIVIACVLKHVIEGKIEEDVIGILGRRRNKVLDKFKGKIKYCKLKEEA